MINYTKKRGIMCECCGGDCKIGCDELFFIDERVQAKEKIMEILRNPNFSTYQENHEFRQFITELRQDLNYIKGLLQ